MSTVPIEEIAWGEGQELDVVKLWAQHSPMGEEAHRYVKSLEFDPYDVLVLREKGLPLCVLEAKVRRVRFEEYGDVMTPLSKHQFARELSAYSIPYFLVTLYSCGALVQVNLLNEPQERRKVARRDRPGMRPVMHGLWKGSGLQVLRETP